MVTAVVVRFPHAHAVVGEVDIAIVAEELWHGGDGASKVRGARIQLAREGRCVLSASTAQASKNLEHRRFLSPIGLAQSTPNITEAVVPVSRSCCCIIINKGVSIKSLVTVFEYFNDYQSSFPFTLLDAQTPKHPYFR
jgi:hypothetical protein